MLLPSVIHTPFVWNFILNTNNVFTIIFMVGKLLWAQLPEGQAIDYYCCVLAKPPIKLMVAVVTHRPRAEALVLNSLYFSK